MINKVIHTADPRMKELLSVAENIASSKASVLIYGESGTGKELLARFIHGKSARSDKRFYAINCAAMPEGLLESELFGYEKGAFTGAQQRKIGLLESASGSTFLLDEISELPLLLQAKLLRVLQEGEVQRLGGSQPISVDVRVIATSNKDLPQLIQERLFREDLYYRLNVIPLFIPGLRERPKDIELLSRFFVEMSCDNNGIPCKSLSQFALNKIMSWRWPGNVRELQNTMERSVLMSKSAEIMTEELSISGFAEPERPVRKSSIEAGMTVSEAEKLLILKTLEHTNQNRTRAAELLGISIRTLRNKINEYKSEVSV